MRPPGANNPGCDALAPSGSPLALAAPLTVLKALLLLAKPGIVLAELLAGLAGALLASPSPAADRLLPALLCLAMASGGAAMANGLLDAEQDRKMPRLARRALALETAGKELVRITAALLHGGAAILAAIYFSPLILILLAAASLGYIGVYTGWLKRRTPWSVLAGGIPGALPPLIGAAAVSGTVPPPPLLLGVIVYVWQLPHFWFLALQCREQYHLAGIPVLPLVHGEGTTGLLIRLCSLALVPCAVAFSSSIGHPPFIALFLPVSALIFSLFCHTCLCRTADYRRGFVASIAYMTLTLLAVIGNAISCATF
ncbi:MAG TPA: protoheme IX farnesyltransferase [Geobacteraceae bacterium]|nr:protoheme IX farnesyltransferase [Geobacteraceae bacterium]